MDRLGPETRLWSIDGKALALTSSGVEFSVDSFLSESNGEDHSFVLEPGEDWKRYIGKDEVRFVSRGESTNPDFDVCILATDLHPRSMIIEAFASIFNEGKESITAETGALPSVTDEESTSSGSLGRDDSKEEDSTSNDQSTEINNLSESAESDKHAASSGSSGQDVTSEAVKEVETSEATAQELDLGNVSDLADLLSLFASDTKLYLYLKLWDGHSASEVADEFDVTRQAMYNHIRGFKDAGLITSPRGSKGYNFTKEGVDVAKWLLSGLELAPPPDVDVIEIVATEDIGEVLGVDEETYYLEKGDLIEMPTVNAGPLLEEGLAVRVNKDSEDDS